MTPLIKHEYNMVHSLMGGLVGEDERNLLKMATSDTLTGIGNRRLFEEVFQAYQSLGERYNVSLFLLLFDIDNFQSIKIEPNETLERVFERADKALYRAKRDGKNCVRMEL